ncbi:MAG: cryptochrome/photolyase family protein [Myxococcota bacterium]
MSVFLAALAARRAPDRDRRWLYLPYDQLTDRVGPLARAAPDEVGIVLVETAWKAGRRPYHQQKLALVLANQRQFALEQAARGVAVDYRFDRRPYAAVLDEVVAERGPLVAMVPAERELRADLGPLVERGGIELVPHEGWLTTDADFAALGGSPWRMDAFYRGVRRRTGILMDSGKPVGGKFSLDADNREAWRGEPPAPAPLTFRPDAVTSEVCDLVRARFADHPGRVEPERLPATAADAEALWDWARRRCLPQFGTYEDAMSTASGGLFHTRISPLLNNLRLLARRVVDDVAQDDTVPLNSREGFVRQVLGWREYVRHVHAATDGFADRADRLGRADPLPRAYWEGAPSGLRCLDTLVAQVWDEGWTHHIPRLMVLSNLACLLDVAPTALSDWFWEAYVDAYDWVVEPNVLGMSTFSVGDQMTTKPYVAGAAYIDRMGDFCRGCAFDPKETCPITPMYWAFLARHRAALDPVDRLRMPLRSVDQRDPAKRAADAQVFERVRDVLRAGGRLRPGFER